MLFYDKYIYSRLVCILGNPKPIREIRERLIPLAQGEVLEVGAGPGTNFVHYDPARVSKLYALEPNPEMIRLAERQRRRTALNVEYLGLPGERIPLGDSTVDTVVSTFTLCTVPSVAEVIRGLGRVVKPGGEFIFFENALSPDPRVRRWQQRWEPVLSRVFVGLRLTLDIPSLIMRGGFEIEQMQAACLAALPRSWTYCCWGTAKRP
jgi:ubiquinone/menaquinone biosynthesis C-methylase UbiE